MTPAPPQVSARNLRELSVFGIKRSGNHAIIGWLIRELGDRVVHLNDVAGPDPYLSCSEIETKGLPVSLCRPTFWNRLTPMRGDAGPQLYSAQDRHLDREATRAFAPKDALILSYEDRLPDDATVAPLPGGERFLRPAAPGQ